MALSPWTLAGIAFQAIPLALSSILLHEIGHAVCGHLAGFRVTALGFGVAEPLCVLRVAGLRFYLCRRAPLQAITWAVFPALFAPRGRTVLLLLGGPLTNLLLGLICLAVIPLWDRAPVALAQMASLNFLFAFVNLVPFRQSRRFATLRSDGAQLIAALRRGGIRPVVLPGAHLALRPLWEAIGDTEILRHQLLTAAAQALEIEDGENARRWRAEAQALPATENPGSHALAELIGAELRRAAGDADGAEAALAELSERCAAEGREADRLFVEAQRRDAGALARLAALEDTAPLARQPPLRTVYWWGRIQLAALHAPEQLDRNLARYEAARREWRSWPLDLSLYRVVAFQREEQGDRAGAAVAYEQALRAFQAIRAGLASDARQQKSFEERQRALRERAARCFAELGRQGDAERLTAPR
jgi:hypothetical protein